MNLAALIRRVRLLADDRGDPPFWADEDITDWLNEATTEAAIRGRLLRVTAESNPSLCELGATAGDPAATLHEAMYEISHQSWLKAGETRREPLCLRSRERLDREWPDWRNLDPDEPRYLIQDDRLLQLVPAPSADGAILLEGYCTPLSVMVADDDEPPIPAIHHIHLVQWALHVGYSLPDAETFNPDKSARAEFEFSRYFGARPDSDLRMNTRHDEPQHVVAHW